MTLEAATLVGGPPVVNSLTPTSGLPGTQVVIAGQNFGNTQGTGTVTFNGASATPTSWSNNSIAVAVPTNATTGPVVVTARGQASSGTQFTVTPQISGVTPGSGVVGTSVTVSGNNFGASQGTSTLTFNGVSATPTSWANTSITAPVPAGATTGPVVVNVGGVASGSVSFTVVTTGTLNGTVTRTSDGGPSPGVTVEALQAGVVKASAVSAADGTYSMTGVTAGTYDLRASAVGSQTETRNGVVVAAGGTTTQNFALVNVGSASGKVTRADGVTAIAGATVKLYQGGTLAATATTNSTGDYSIANLVGGYYTFEASAAGYITVSRSGLVTGNSNTTVNISLDVIAGGPVTYVYDELGRLVSASTPTETVTYNYDAVGNLLSIQRQSSSQVAITEFTPNSGTAGTPVTIYGTGFSANAVDNTVTFNGTAATVSAATATQINTTVPAGATTGAITVTTPSGTATSTTPFTVNGSGVPTITSFTPSVGAVGSNVTVNGTNFETVPTNNRVKVNLTRGVVSSATATSLVAQIAYGTASGRVSVSMPAGTAVSVADFFVAPAPYTAADVETTGRMAVGQSSSVNITTANKIGLVVFDAVAGQRVSLLLNGSTMAGGTATIYNPDGTTLNSSNFDASGGFLDARDLPATGTYTILVDPSSTNTGGITLNLYNVVDVTGPIMPGGASVPTTVATPGQNLLLTFGGTAGQKVSLGISGITYGYVMWDTLDVQIKDPNGNVLGSTSINGYTSTFLDTITLPVAGTYTIYLNPSGARTGSATFTLYDITDVTDTISVGGPSVTKSTTLPGQNMRLSFDGTAGQKVSVNTTISGWTSAPRLSLLRPDGSVLVGPNSYFLDATTLPSTGTYMDETGTITFTAYNVVDVTGTTSIGGPTVPVSLYTPGQNMSLTFDGTAGQKISLNITNNTFGYIPYGNTYVQIKKPDGTVLAQLDVNAGSGPIILDATALPSTGTYTISLDPSGARTGGFNLSLVEVVDVTGTIAPDGTPVTKTTTAPGQNIRLTFDGTAGQKVSLSTTISGFSSWPALYIYKPDGTVLAGPASSSIGTATLPVNGTYTILSDPYDTQTGTQTFTLTNVP